MFINLVCVGTKMPNWVTNACDEYTKRLTRDVKLKIIEVEAYRRSKTVSADKIKQEEAKKLKLAIPKNNYLIALDVKGKSWSTEELSRQMEQWQHLGKDVSLLVGGADGLEPTLLNSCSKVWSLSELTYPHPIVRIVISEQIYRAWSMLNNHPYHRE